MSPLPLHWEGLQRRRFPQLGPRQSRKWLLLRSLPATLKGLLRRIRALRSSLQLRRGTVGRWLIENSGSHFSEVPFACLMQI